MGTLTPSDRISSRTAGDRVRSESQRLSKYRLSIRSPGRGRCGTALWTSEMIRLPLRLARRATEAYAGAKNDSQYENTTRSYASRLMRLPVDLHVSGLIESSCAIVSSESGR